eukprot:gene15734-21301_t
MNEQSRHSNDLLDSLVIYSGEKNFDSPCNLSIDISIVNHLKCSCIEVITYNPDMKQELNRVYLSLFGLKENINQYVFSHKLTLKLSEMKISNNDKSAMKVAMESVLQELIIETILHNMCIVPLNSCFDQNIANEQHHDFQHSSNSNFRVEFSKNNDDIDFRDIIMKDIPNHLIPCVIKHCAKPKPGLLSKLFDLAVAELNNDLSMAREERDEADNQLSDALPVLDNLVSARKHTKRIAAQSRWTTAFKSATSNKLQSEDNAIKANRKDEPEAWDLLLSQQKCKTPILPAVNASNNSMLNNDHGINKSHNKQRKYNRSKKCTLFSRRINRMNHERVVQYPYGVYDYDYEEIEKFFPIQKHVLLQSKSVKPTVILPLLSHLSPNNNPSDYLSVKSKSFCCPILPLILPPNKNDVTKTSRIRLK